MLRIAIGLDKTKNQQVTRLECTLSKTALEIQVTGTGNFNLEIWAAQCDRNVLATAIERDIEIQPDASR